MEEEGRRICEGKENNRKQKDKHVKVIIEKKTKKKT